MLLGWLLCASCSWRDHWRYLAQFFLLSPSPGWGWKCSRFVSHFPFLVNIPRPVSRASCFCLVLVLLVHAVEVLSFSHLFSFLVVGVFSLPGGRWVVKLSSFLRVLVSACYFLRCPIVVSDFYIFPVGLFHFHPLLLGGVRCWVLSVRGGRAHVRENGFHCLE